LTTLNVVTRNPIIIIVESVHIGRIIYQYFIHRYNNSYTVLWYLVPGTRGPHCREQQQQIISDFATIIMSSSNPHFTNMAHMDSCDHRPHNIVQCLDANGEVEPEKYFQYLHFLSYVGSTLLVPSPEIQIRNNVPPPPRVRVRGKNKQGL